MGAPRRRSYGRRVLAWFGSLFVVAWGIGVLVVPHAPWFLHFPLLVGGGAMVVAAVAKRWP